MPTALLRLNKLFANSKSIDEFEPGDVVFAEGSSGSFMYVVVEGTIDIFAGDERIDISGPGDLVGEMALIDSNVRSASAVARTEARLARVDENEFLHMVVDTPFFALHVMRELVQRLRRSAMRS